MNRLQLYGARPEVTGRWLSLIGLMHRSKGGLQMTASVRRATLADIDELASILTAGFADDPFLVWIYRTEEQYQRLAPGYFRWMAERTLAIGRAYIAGDGKGAVLGQPSSTVDTSDEEDAQIQEQLRSVGAECSDHLLAFADAAHANHPMERPHWYLTFLGVRPDHRSKGLGSALVNRTLAEAKLPGYLESTCQRNRELYERLGFKALGDFSVTDGILLSPMWCGATPSEKHRQGTKEP